MLLLAQRQLLVACALTSRLPNELIRSVISFMPRDYSIEPRAGSPSGARASLFLIGGASDTLHVRESDATLEVRVFTDHRIVEAFWQDGRVAMTRAAAQRTAPPGPWAAPREATRNRTRACPRFVV